LDIYFTRIYLIKAFVIALSLSAFIYCDTFELTHLWLNSLFALLGFYLLLGAHKVVWFWSGFFIGILWFYWISFSFIYYDLVFLIPFIIISLALVYGVWFWAIGRWIRNTYAQAFCIWSMSFIAPFGFNWFKPELILIHTYFSTSSLYVILFLGGIALLKASSLVGKSAGIAVLAFVLWFPSSISHVVLPASIDVAIPSMHIEQSKRWDKAYQKDAIDANFALIEEAIANKKELIILPESAFPLYLNHEEALIEKLKAYSYSISIVTGALTYENEAFFNSSYLFEAGQMHIAHKVVLVPFGEEVPFPEFLTTLINQLFFDGAKDYTKAQKPYDFTIQGMTFRNAICYEATTDILYENNPKHMVAISNNAWFTPSIEPTLQHLLLKLYARKYNTLIYHSANGGKSGIIYP